MRLGLILIVLGLYLYQCNGAPPKEVAAKANSCGFRYKDQEDELIIEELSRLPLDTEQVFSKSIWEHVAAKHRQKWAQNTSGFPQERTWLSLRSRLVYMLKHKHSQLLKKLPEELLQKFRKDLNKPASGLKPHYTGEEHNLIIQELLNPSITNPFALTVMDDIRAKLEEKGRGNTPGFSNSCGRTSYGLRSHLGVMKSNGQLPDEIVKKIRKYGKGSGASSSNAPSDEATDLQEIMEEDADEGI